MFRFSCHTACLIGLTKPYRKDIQRQTVSVSLGRVFSDNDILTLKVSSNRELRPNGAVVYVLVPLDFSPPKLERCHFQGEDVVNLPLKSEDERGPKIMERKTVINICWCLFLIQI